jgi:hypothetical protein
MSGPSCYNCVFARCDPEEWLRCDYMGAPLVPRCANQPWSTGKLEEVSGTPCRNYRRKPDPPTGHVRLIPMSDGGYVYVDAADYEWLRPYNWHSNNGYAARNENRKTILMHRQIMQPPQGMVVDHADGNKANNCRANLRVCTPAENHRNTRRMTVSISVYKGVSYDKRRHKWKAQCCEDRSQQTSRLDGEVEAARAYDRMAVEHFGEFARLNFPREWPTDRRKQVYEEHKAREKGTEPHPPG